ncbi:MAG TPA: CARDB domain-containing protein [Dehalococcoidia bacterium]|nr:CARDB domain-containing protein [Dehalococcoidia bacterium]
MRFLPGPETRAAVIRHPFVLAGVAVVVLLGLTAGVLIIIDSARGGSAQEPKVQIEEVTATTGPTAKTAEAGGVRAKADHAIPVKSAPGTTTPPLGTLPGGAEMVVDGRTTDTKWLRIIFPPGSELHGWVDAADVDVTSGDPAALTVATAEPPVVVEVPTLPPTSTPEVLPTETPTETPVGGGLPDLTIGTTPTITGGKLFVTVTNIGRGVATGDLVVAVFNDDGTRLLGGATVPGATVGPGESVDVGTGLAITGTQTLLIVVDPNGDIEETDNTNNRVLINVAVGEPTPTETAPPPGGPPPGAPPAP